MIQASPLFVLRFSRQHPRLTPSLMIIKRLDQHLRWSTNEKQGDILKIRSYLIEIAIISPYFLKWLTVCLLACSFSWLPIGWLIDRLIDFLFQAVDTCVSNPCINGGTCVNTKESYRCECPHGYNGDNCQNEFDECLPSPCYRSSTCVNKVFYQLQWSFFS